MSPSSTFLILALLLIATVTPDCLAAQVQTLIFPSQKPIDHQPWTVPEKGSYQCKLSVDEMVVKWVEPDAGVTSHTGILVILHGISLAADCDKPFYEWDPTWANTRNLIVCNVYYRNINFYPPYDFGLYQMVDVLRGVGWLLDSYPEANRQRLYLWGGSGGGHVALQLAAVYPEFWAEIYAHAPITKITTANDLIQNHYEQDPAPYGWNVNFVPPTSQSGMTDQQRRQLEAERLIRSPQWNFGQIDKTAVAATQITIFHGTADDVTDYQHFIDLKNVVSSRFDSTSQSVYADYAEGTVIANWTFWSILQGGHSYAGAHPSLSDRAAATNTLCPDAFTSINPYVPSLIVDGRLPVTDLWQYHLTGPLKTCEISVTQSAGVDFWMMLD